MLSSFWPLWKIYLIILAGFGVFFYLTATLFYLVSPRNSFLEFRKTQFWKEILITNINLVILAVSCFLTYLLWYNGHTLIYHEISKYGVIYYLATILAAVLIHSSYFYWTHRLLHSIPLLKKYHNLHHSEHNPTPLTSYYFHPVEGIIVSGVIPLIAFLIPVHWTVIPIFVGLMTFITIYGHSGLEFFPGNIYKNWPGKWLSSSTHHQQHHNHGTGNYGIYFCFWDNLMGTERKDFSEHFNKVTSREKGLNAFQFRKKLPSISIFMLIIFLNMLLGCNYYKSTIIRAPSYHIMEPMKRTSDQVILHQGMTIKDTPAWYLENVKLDLESGVISAELGRAWSHRGVKRNSWKTEPEEKTRGGYNKSNHPSLINQVHIYVPSLDTLDGKIEISTSELLAVEVFDRDQTRESIAGASLAVGLVALIAVFVAAASSCPFVYSANSNGLSFAGEIYGGAVYKSLERHDFLKLDDIERVNGRYQLTVANELHEKQYINLLELIRVSHAPEVKVHADQYGKFYTIERPISPSTAISGNRTDLTILIDARDKIYYLFNQISDDHAISQLDLSFNRVSDTNHAKLLLSLRNSVFGDYVYGEFTKYFGNHYPKWIAEQALKPADDHIQWQKDQKVMLEVQMKTKKGWKTIDYLYPVGPFGQKELVVPIDLAHHSDEQIDIRLVSGFMFWEIDQVLMDFTENRPFLVEKLQALESQSDSTELITRDDALYLHQAEMGDFSMFEFEANKETKDQIHSVFLHSKGYYEHQREYENYPDIISLYQFKQPGKLSGFSFEKYMELARLMPLEPVSLNNRK